MLTLKTLYKLKAYKNPKNINTIAAINYLCQIAGQTNIINLPTNWANLKNIQQLTTEVTAKKGHVLIYIQGKQPTILTQKLNKNLQTKSWTNGQLTNFKKITKTQLPNFLILISTEKAQLTHIYNEVIKINIPIASITPLNLTSNKSTYYFPIDFKNKKLIKELVNYFQHSIRVGNIKATLKLKNQALKLPRLDSNQ